VPTAKLYFSLKYDFQMNNQGYNIFANKVPRDTRLAFEATSMAYPFFRMLKGLGYDDVTIAHPSCPRLM
jgi:hypothetical protein